jgi:hypothetical protein
MWVKRMGTRGVFKDVYNLSSLFPKGMGERMELGWG